VFYLRGIWSEHKQEPVGYAPAKSHVTLLHVFLVAESRAVTESLQ